MAQLAAVRSALAQSITTPPDRASAFFKTEPGSYAAHDQFLGIPVPTLRTIAKSFQDLSPDDLATLFASPFNEERLLALIILVAQYEKADQQGKETIYQFYMKHLDQVSNWNLVDSSAHLILGRHLFEANQSDHSQLSKLAQSTNLWERRIAIVATWYTIKNNHLDWTFSIAKLLLNDKHDLIHKAVGWMLREAGKKDGTQLVAFLDVYAQSMPRTMLRYAIEKFTPHQRICYLHR